MPEREEMTPYRVAQLIKNKFGEHFDILVVCAGKEDDNMAIIKIKKKASE